MTDKEKIMLKIENLSFSYKKGRPVLKGIDLTLNEGIYALVGKNGCGKSTLMKLICTSLTAREGVISIDGVHSREEGYNAKLSYLPQVFDIYGSLRVREVLAFAAGIIGVSKSDMNEVINTVADMANVTEYLNRKFSRCSEGTRRRVGIAVSLIGDKNVIILDEPTAGLDPSERARFYETVLRCFAGKTVLLSTHILEDIEQLADNVLMMSNGRITYSGTYSDYCRVLDGRLYTARIPVKMRDSCVILSESRTPEREVISRVVSDTPLPDDWSPIAVEPTREDVWNYFEGEYR